MTRTTGWVGDEPDGQAPEPRRAAGFAEFILANRVPPEQRGSTLEQVLGRAALAPDRGGYEPEDDLDDRYAGMLTRDYDPGSLSRLSLRLADVSAALQEEQEKIERAERRAEQVRRMHERGQVRAMDIPNLLGDEGDENRVRQLQHQEASLRRQLEEAAVAISPPSRRDPDPLEAASRRAHAAFVEVTRARMAEAEAGVRRSEPRPFASVSRGAGDGTEHTGSDCRICAEGRRMDAADRGEDPYPPGAVITTGYRELAR